MIKLVGLILLLQASSVLALVPVEGIILGEASEEIQTDPLISIFSDIYDKSKEGENRKLKLYQSTYRSGQNLVESCSYLDVPKYSTPWQEKQARRSIAATLQYIGLDTTIKAIGAYAKKLEVGADEFGRLSKNLVNNFCSKNVTVFSLRNIEKTLQYYYQNPQMNLIPSVADSPFATEAVKKSTESPSARSREFDKVLSSFRAFCSWGGDVEDYRMLNPYLNNRFIMAFVFKNMAGLQDKVDEKIQRVETVKSKDTVQVACTDLICRKENFEEFQGKFPLSVGSTGLFTDLSKNFCHHFRFQDAPRTSVEAIKTWVKEQELEEPILETSQFISLMTGVPDFMNGVKTFVDIPLLVRSNIDERWTTWAGNVLKTFSRDLMYEESLKVKVEPRRDRALLATDGFEIDFTVTLGELDRLLKDSDKLDLSFDLKLSKNYLRKIKSRWAELENEVDTEGQKNFREDVSRYINHQLKAKEKLFTQKLWNDEFSRLIADELIQQAKTYQGPMFQSYRDEVLRVPVKFSYGLFALSYLKYRADVAKDRLKVTL